MHHTVTARICPSIHFRIDRGNTTFLHAYVFCTLSGNFKDQTSTIQYILSIHWSQGTHICVDEMSRRWTLASKSLFEAVRNCHFESHKNYSDTLIKLHHGKDFENGVCNMFDPFVQTEYVKDLRQQPYILRNALSVKRTAAKTVAFVIQMAPPRCV